MQRLFSRSFLAGLVFLLITLASPAFAANNLQPRWTELNTYQCEITYHKGLFSNATVASTVSTHSSSSGLELTLTIQRWNGSEYIDTSYSWSTKGSGATSIEKTVLLSQGNYRAKAVVNVYSSVSVYIETVIRYSDSMIV